MTHWVVSQIVSMQQTSSSSPLPPVAPGQLHCLHLESVGEVLETSAETLTTLGNRLACTYLNSTLIGQDRLTPRCEGSESLEEAADTERSCHTGLASIVIDVRKKQAGLCEKDGMRPADFP